MARQGRAGAALAIAAARLVLRRHASATLHPRAVRHRRSPSGAAVRSRRVFLADGPGPDRRGRRWPRARVLKAHRHDLLGLLLGLVGTDVTTGAIALHLRHSAALRTGSIRVDRGRHLRLRRDPRATWSTTEVREPSAGEITSLWPTRRTSARSAPAVLRGTAIGSVARHPARRRRDACSFVAYALEKKLSRPRDEFGKGAIEGVAGAGGGQQRRRPDLLHSRC